MGTRTWQILIQILFLPSEDVNPWAGSRLHWTSTSLYVTCDWCYFSDAVFQDLVQNLYSSPRSAHKYHRVQGVVLVGNGGRFLICSRCCCCCQVASVVSDSVRPHRWQPTRLPHPWDSPGKNTGVGCHFLLQCMNMKSEREVAHLGLTLSDPMDCSLPGSSIHGIFQARVLVQ